MKNARNIDLTYFFASSQGSLLKDYLIHVHITRYSSKHIRIQNYPNYYYSKRNRTPSIKSLCQSFDTSGSGQVPQKPCGSPG